MSGEAEFRGAGVDDVDEVAPPTPPGERFRAEMLGELAADVEKDDLVLEVRTRPGWAVRYSTFIDAGLMEKWAEKSQSKVGNQTRLDQFGLSLRTVAGQCKGLIRDGQDVVIDDEPLTFGHQAMRDMYGTIDAIGTVRRFFGDDALVGSHYLAVLDAAGAGEMPVRLDPTSGSSG